ncbi:hypothetical protein [Shewanella algae]|nr:hypothetical protein [Shewanella algae]
MELNTSGPLAMGFLSICTAGDGQQLSQQLNQQITQGHWLVFA